MKPFAIIFAIQFLFVGCGTIHKQVVMFQEKTVRVSAGAHTIHVISDYYSKAYLIESDEGLVLVDTGAQGNARKILDEIRRIQERSPQKKLKLIFLTHAHFDHYANAKALRIATGAPVAIHPADAGYLERGETPLPHVRKHGFLMKAVFPVREFFRPTPKTKADILTPDGFDLKRYGINGRVVALPGHTQGSSMLWLEEKYAFVGDLVASGRKVRRQDLFADDWEKLGESIERLKAYRPELVFPGHGKYFEGRLLPPK